MKLQSFFKVAALALATTVALPALPVAADSNIHTFADGHPPAMKRAITKAQKSLPALLAKTLDGSGRMSSSATLKVAIPANGGIENIWVHSVRKGSAGYTARLANVPRFIKGKGIGDSVRFKEPQIIDWALQASDGRYFGHFTTRVIVKQMTGEQARSVRAILTRSPLPKGF